MRVSVSVATGVCVRVCVRMCVCVRLQLLLHQRVGQLLELGQAEGGRRLRWVVMMVMTHVAPAEIGHLTPAHALVQTQTRRGGRTQTRRGGRPPRRIRQGREAARRDRAVGQRLLRKSVCVRERVCLHVRGRVFTL